MGHLRKTNESRLKIYPELLRQEQGERKMEGKCGAEGGLCRPTDLVLQRGRWAHISSLVCDTSPGHQAPSETNAVVRTEDPEWHSTRSPLTLKNLSKTLLRDLHLKLVMGLALGSQPYICLGCGAGVICVLCVLLLVVTSRVIKPNKDGQEAKVMPERGAEG